MLSRFVSASQRLYIRDTSNPMDVRPVKQSSLIIMCSTMVVSSLSILFHLIFLQPADSTFTAIGNSPPTLCFRPSSSSQGSSHDQMTAQMQTMSFNSNGQNGGRFGGLQSNNGGSSRKRDLCVTNAFHTADFGNVRLGCFRLNDIQLVIAEPEKLWYFNPAQPTEKVLDWAISYSKVSATLQVGNCEHELSAQTRPWQMLQGRVTLHTTRENGEIVERIKNSQYNGKDMQIAEFGQTGEIEKLLKNLKMTPDHLLNNAVESIIWKVMDVLVKGYYKLNPQRLVNMLSADEEEE